MAILFVMPIYMLHNTQHVQGQPAGTQELIDPIRTTTNSSSSDNAIDLLNSTTFDWKPVYAKVSQDNNKLDITVDTDSTEKLYNRAYMQTQLNTLTQGREVQVPLILAMDYVAESLEGNATFVLEIRDRGTGDTLFSRELSNQRTFAISPISANMTNKPVEFRLYIITDEPGSHILAVDKAFLTASITDLVTNFVLKGEPRQVDSLNSNIQDGKVERLPSMPWIKLP